MKRLSLLHTSLSIVVFVGILPGVLSQSCYLCSTLESNKCDLNNFNSSFAVLQTTDIPISLDYGSYFIYDIRRYIQGSKFDCSKCAVSVLRHNQPLLPNPIVLRSCALYNYYSNYFYCNTFDVDADGFTFTVTSTCCQGDRCNGALQKSISFSTVLLTLALTAVHYIKSY